MGDKEELPPININLNMADETLDMQIYHRQSIAFAKRVDDMYDEILRDIRVGEEVVDDVFRCFYEMVANRPDGTSSSKEALVNLAKLKVDQADKKMRLMDSYVKAVKPAQPKITATQNNKVEVVGPKKREFLQSLQPAKESDMIEKNN